MGIPAKCSHLGDVIETVVPYGYVEVSVDVICSTLGYILAHGGQCAVLNRRLAAGFGGKESLGNSFFRAKADVQDVFSYRRSAALPRVFSHGRQNGVLDPGLPSLTLVCWHVVEPWVARTFSWKCD